MQQCQKHIKLLASKGGLQGWGGVCVPTVCVEQLRFLGLLLPEQLRGGISDSIMGNGLPVSVVSVSFSLAAMRRAEGEAAVNAFLGNLSENHMLFFFFFFFLFLFLEHTNVTPVNFKIVIKWCVYYCCYVPLSNNLHQSLSSSSPIKTKTDLKFSSLGNCSLKQEPSELLEGISMFFHLYSSMLLTEMFHSALQFSFHHSLLWTISCFFPAEKFLFLS